MFVTTAGQFLIAFVGVIVCRIPEVKIVRATAGQVLSDTCTQNCAGNRREKNVRITKGVGVLVRDGVVLCVWWGGGGPKNICFPYVCPICNGTSRAPLG